MKIGIDISQIVYGTGVSIYTKKLVENLLRIDKENEYKLFAGSLRRRADILKMFPQAKIFPIPPTMADFIWNRLHILPIEKLIGPIDIFHSSDWTEPPTSALKVTTVHDLYPLKFPKLVSPLVREVHRRRLGWVISECERVIVPSESTKKDLIDFGMNEEKVRVIGEAASLEKASAEKVVEAKKKYGVEGNYIISIGVGKLKNTSNIVRAFHLARPGKDIKLLLAGRSPRMEIPEERNVRILGYVPQEDLGALLTGASGLVFASIYEGYGIPILDAFTCGVPVVTSNTSSMPEIAGSAAVLVDPNEVGSIKEGIETILRGPKAYIDKGNERVKEFSWEKTARKTLAVYNELK